MMSLTIEDSFNTNHTNKTAILEENKTKAINNIRIKQDISGNVALTEIIMQFHNTPL